MVFVRKNSGAKAIKRSALCRSDRDSCVNSLSVSGKAGAKPAHTCTQADGDIMGIMNLCHVVFEILHLVSRLLVLRLLKAPSSPGRQYGRDVLTIDKWIFCFIVWTGVLPQSESEAA
ncbi:hypothetical protein [Allorhizobium terrae]|uniref:Uncharacterized protein n=1 Tax=Allorhizobium terrae TaxID=1848972 RepID=A0A4S3ZW98_9HYPH|nr:hypothetical protein [Allorhizobium terrae]THF50083.1 hypothetical protein E6C51_10010 [Allorhizobium terrae]TWD53494.1 hypothetical protein FB480_104318 [Agrobacterium vitis]